MTRTRWVVLLMGLVLMVVSASGCSRTSTQVAGVYAGEPELPEGFTRRVRIVLEMVADDEFPLDSLEIRSVLHLGTHTRRMMGQPFGPTPVTRTEDSYLVVATLEGDGAVKAVMALIRVGADDDHYLLEGMSCMRTTVHEGPPVEVRSRVCRLRDDVVADVLAGWVRQEGVGAFTIDLEDGPELKLDGTEHQFFTALIDTRPPPGVYGEAAIEEIVVYDLRGEVIGRYQGH